MPQPILEPIVNTVSSSPRSLFGTCLWEFDGSQWAVKSLDAENGGAAGEPPRQPGRFKGQLRVTPCVAGA